MQLYGRLLDEFKNSGLDYLVLWPYDEGGCGCNNCRLWGRAKFAVTDWDSDGAWDVVFGTSRADQRFFSKECAHREATPFLLRNVGSAAAPVFEPPVPIKLGDQYLAFGCHIAAAWPTDMDGDGRDGLIIGAKDGRVYRFLRGACAVEWENDKPQVPLKELRIEATPAGSLSLIALLALTRYE